MALVNCPECGASISDNTIDCPQCGYLNKAEAGRCARIFCCVCGCAIRS